MFLQLFGLKSRALELVPRKTIKNAKNDVFATFAPKTGLFSLKTAAKARTELQQGKTSMKKRIPIKKCTIKNLFFTVLQKTDTSGMREGTFAVSFLYTQTS